VYPYPIPCGTRKASRRLVFPLAFVPTKIFNAPRSRDTFSKLLNPSISAPRASADVVFSVTGQQVYEIGVGYHWYAEGWSLNQAYSNVSVATTVGNPGDRVSFYLTTGIGPGTAADVVASTTFTPLSSQETDTVFSGLDLGPGNYFVVMASFSGSVWWPGNPATVQVAPGVTDLRCAVRFS